jgi:hypothetical protein
MGVAWHCAMGKGMGMGIGLEAGRDAPDRRMVPGII